MDGASNIDTFCVKPIFGPCIADFCNTAAGNLLKIWGCLAGDLAHDVHGSRFRCDLYCTPGFGIFVQQRIENTVRNKITDFVRMAFSDRFGSQEFSHSSHLLLYFFSDREFSLSIAMDQVF